MSHIAKCQNNLSVPFHCLCVQGVAPYASIWFKYLSMEVDDEDQKPLSTISLMDMSRVQARRDAVPRTPRPCGDFPGCASFISSHITQEMVEAFNLLSDTVLSKREPLFFYRLSSSMLTRLSLSRSLYLNSINHFFFHHVQRASPRPLIFEDKTRTESKYLSLGSTSPEVPAPSKAPKSETLFPLGKAV